MSINVVTLSGRVSRPPKRVRAPGNSDGHVHVFPLAVRQGTEIVFPVVVAGEIPPFALYRQGHKLHEQPLVTVVGRVRTRNLTQRLTDEVAAQAKKAGVEQEALAAVREQLAALGIESRRVVTEIVADAIHEGGSW